MKRVIYFLLLLFPICLSAQPLPVHTHFFLNPYFINPAYVGPHDYPEVFVTHRQKPQGIATAPVTTALSFHLPTKGHAAFGLNVVDNVTGLLAHTSTLATFGYTFTLGEEHYLRIAVSGGLGKYSVDRNRLQQEGDWERVKSFNNKSFFNGNAGFNYQLKGFTIGISLPTLLNTRVINTNTADPLDFRRINYYVLNAGYHIKLSDHFAVAPQVLYHYSTDVPSQYEALGALYYRSLWLGGGYRQQAGSFAFAGVKIKKTVGLSYAYEPMPNQLTDFSSSTHEVLLSIGFEQKKGKKKKAKKPSPITQAKEKPTPAQAEAEKKKPVKTKPEQPAAKSSATDEKLSAEKEAAKIAAAKPSGEATVRKQPAKKDEEKIEAHQRKHPLELKKGTYVVVGSFNIFDNAMRYNRMFYTQGFRSDYRYSSKTNHYYVFVYYSDDVEAARAERDRLRQREATSDAWVLIVE